MFKRIFNLIWEVLKVFIITLLIVVPIRYFIFQPFFVRGQSMEPNFHDGDYLIVDELSYRFRSPHRGEVIVFKNPINPTQRYIKRIIGLPGEKIKIEDGKVFISSSDDNMFLLDESAYLPDTIKTLGKIDIVINQDEYFVMGDNRYHSSDSRSWGLLPKENIVGRVLLRLWPPNALAWFEVPSYSY